MTLYRRFFRWFWLPAYRWYALRRMQKPSIWHWNGLRIEVPTGVFHPGLFFSTPIFLEFLAAQDLRGTTCIDVGTGSGAIALGVAQQGANVWAVDINPAAVATARRNAATNQLRVTVLESDLFGAIGPEDPRFDYVLANPPYYPQAAATPAEQAFFAGPQLSYFERFFEEVGPFTKPQAIIWMILSEDCDWPLISRYASAAGWQSRQIHQRTKWGERLFVAEFIRNT
jgi:release factor glutamine methyltransferase